jgi:hypothetical protein
LLSKNPNIFHLPYSFCFQFRCPLYSAYQGQVHHPLPTPPTTLFFRTTCIAKSRQSAGSEVTMLEVQIQFLLENAFKFVWVRSTIFIDIETYRSDTRTSISCKAARGVKFNIHFHLEPRLKLSRAVPPHSYRKPPPAIFPHRWNNPFRTHTMSRSGACHYFVIRRS